MSRHEFRDAPEHVRPKTGHTPIKQVKQWDTVRPGKSHGRRRGSASPPLKGGRALRPSYPQAVFGVKSQVKNRVKNRVPDSHCWMVARAGRGMSTATPAHPCEAGGEGVAHPSRRRDTPRAAVEQLDDHV